jgi:hypothetical protein
MTNIPTKNSGIANIIALVNFLVDGIANGIADGIINGIAYVITDCIAKLD